MYSCAQQFCAGGQFCFVLMWLLADMGFVLHLREMCVN